MHVEAIESSRVVEVTISNGQEGKMAEALMHVLKHNSSVTSNGSLAAGDAFDGSAEPVIYMSDNRMPVMVELSSAIIYIGLAALLLALVFILPGIRKTKLTSFLGLFTILLVGASILLGIEGSYWLSGSLYLHSMPYSALTSDTITGKLEVNIGLTSTNVTLIGHLIDQQQDTAQGSAGSHKGQSNSPQSSTKRVDYNERFHWDKPDRMAAEHVHALRTGLPYPILTITEFLSQDSDGFNWMRQLRQAGYFTSLALYASLASWCLTAVVMCALPVYLPHMMQITGALMMSSVWIYTMLIQSPKSFVIQVGEAPVEFAFGYTYAVTFVAGALSMFAGMLMFVLQLNKPHEQFTIMDSEQYLKNQKVLYGANLGLSTHYVSDHQLNIFKADKSPPYQRQGSVIIPIADIEANFKQTT